jgi:hypothetical protein
LTLVGALVAVACAAIEPTTTTTATPTTATPTTENPTTATPTTATTTAPTSAAPASFPLRVLLTTDEHGWLSPLLDKKSGVLRGGIHAAAGAMRAEGYVKDGPGWLLVFVRCVNFCRAARTVCPPSSARVLMLKS